MIRLKVFLPWLAVLLAAGEFVVRGPLRASAGYVNDFAAPYVSARLWLAHQNPYALDAFFPTWHAAGAPLGPVYANPSSIHSVYPPPSIVALIPFALLSWPVASHALILLSALFYLTSLFLLTTFIPGDWRHPTKPLFLAFGLALAPAHSSIHVSNLACLAASLLFIAIYLLLRPPVFAENPRLFIEKKIAIIVLVAALITYSSCFKPTLAPFILLYLLWARLWRTLALSIAFGLTLTAIALYPLLQQGQQWLTDLRNNVNFIFTAGSANLAPQNLTRFDRIDLQLPLYALTTSRTAAFLLAALLAAALLILWFKIPKATPPTHSLDEHLLRIAALLLIGIFPFYQRFYSAILLLIPVLWAIRQLSPPYEPTRRPTLYLTAQATLVIAALFLFNSEVLLQQTPLVPAGSHHLSLIANAFLGPHLCWLLLALGCLLMASLSAESRPKLASSEPSSL